MFAGKFSMTIGMTTECLYHQIYLVGIINISVINIICFFNCLIWTNEVNNHLYQLGNSYIQAHLEFTFVLVLATYFLCQYLPNYTNATPSY